MGVHALNFNKKIAVAMIALSSVGCSKDIYVSNNFSKTDGSVKKPVANVQSYASNSSIVADFNNDAILDMFISTTKGLIARLGKRNNNYQDTIIYRFDENSKMAPGDITTWFDSETEKQIAFFSVPKEVSYWTIDGKKKFSKKILGIPMNDDDLELSDKINNTILEEGENVWGIIASKNSIFSYKINYSLDDNKNPNKNREHFVNRTKIFDIRNSLAPDITTGDFNGDGLSDIAVLESDKLYFLVRNTTYKDSLVMNYFKGIDLSQIVNKDSVDENSLKIHSIRTLEGLSDNALCSIADYLLYFKYDDKKKEFSCDGAYKMPLEKTSAKLNYNLSVKYNANGNAFIFVSPSSGKKLRYLIGPDGLVEY